MSALQSVLEAPLDAGWTGQALPIPEHGRLASTPCVVSRHRDGPGQREVHVWFARLPTERRFTDVFESLLDRDECARADRFVLARHRARFIHAHGLLRCVLAPYAGRAPADVRFTRTPGGKPELTDAQGWSFSLSHSGDGVAIAVAQGVDVGIDVEEIHPVDVRDHLVARFFSPSEVAAYQAVAPSERQTAFYRLWTRKEAFTKGIGQGLSYPLNAFSVGLAVPVHMHGDGVAPWSLRHLEPGAGFVGALAVRHEHPLLSGGCLCLAATAG